MKNFDRLKTIQLVLFIAFTIACVLLVFLNKDLFHTIAVDTNVKIMCGLLWVALGVSFFFIFCDLQLFTKFKQDYKEIDYAIHSDPVAGIANRYSSDAIIEKYVDKPVPDSIWCIMFELSNIREINKLYGHIQGNVLIREFANVLRLTSVNLCFVARNGGNKYLAIFEDGTEEKVDQFLARVDQKVRAHNREVSTVPIQYSYGIAQQSKDNVKEITQLIALSDRRITDMNN